MLKSVPVGDFASGTIAGHYQEREEFLKEPATAENIKILAVTETAYWRNKTSGMAWLIGGSTPALFRELYLLRTKGQLISEGKWDAAYKQKLD